jgi:hypothetical protein|tara:strand:+ start:1113 stop:1295 length:183 start_codon:yes stop_codon:yes gene_type:complete
LQGELKAQKKIYEDPDSDGNVQVTEERAQQRISLPKNYPAGFFSQKIPIKILLKSGLNAV